MGPFSGSARGDTGGLRYESVPGLQQWSRRSLEFGKPRFERPWSRRNYQRFSPGWSSGGRTARHARRPRRALRLAPLARHTRRLGHPARRPLRGDAQNPGSTDPQPPARNARRRRTSRTGVKPRTRKQTTALRPGSAPRRNPPQACRLNIPPQPERPSHATPPTADPSLDSHISLAENPLHGSQTQAAGMTGQHGEPDMIRLGDRPPQAGPRDIPAGKIFGAAARPARFDRHRPLLPRVWGGPQGPTGPLPQRQAGAFSRRAAWVPGLARREALSLQGGQRHEREAPSDGRSNQPPGRGPKRRLGQGAGRQSLPGGDAAAERHSAWSPASSRGLGRSGRPSSP